MRERRWFDVSVDLVILAFYHAPPLYWGSVGNLITFFTAANFASSLLGLINGRGPAEVCKESQKWKELLRDFVVNLTQAPKDIGKANKNRGYSINFFSYFV